jgi:hypothetical protein
MASKATRRQATFLLFGSVIASCLFLLQEHFSHAGNPGKSDPVAVSLLTFRESQTTLNRKPAALSGNNAWNDTHYPAATDSLCGGCRHAVSDEDQHRCGFWILDFQAKYQLNQIRAAEKVAQRFPETCGNCQPQSCSDADKEYWRYDRVGPRIDHAQTFQLTSIPSIHRLGPHAVSNITAYFSVPEHVYPQVEYLFEYNPSVVRLPASQRPVLAGETPVYLASFRVSNQHYCFPPSDRKLLMAGQKVSPKDWLGLALLRRDLTVIQDVVVDLKKARFPSAQDFRLFVLHDQLYISSYDAVTPLWLIPPLDATNTMLLPIIFGNLAVAVRYFPSCAPCEKKNKGYCGKNMNYFVDANQESVVEIWPSPPHLVRTVNTDIPCRRNETPDSRVDGRLPPVPVSFASIEQLHFPSLDSKETLLTRGRGGACCISLQHPVTGEAVLVGIQHSKTPQQRNKRLPAGNVAPNHYLSSVYAFKPTPPYRMVAQSGYFCLGFPTKREQESNPLVRATTWRKLMLGEEFDCPRIHFVSGMTLKEDDPSTVIIAYGINDCVSRMIEVPVSDLQRLLFANFTLGADGGIVTKL